MSRHPFLSVLSSYANRFAASSTPEHDQCFDPSCSLCFLTSSPDPHCLTRYGRSDLAGGLATVVQGVCGNKGRGERKLEGTDKACRLQPDE